MKYDLIVIGGGAAGFFGAIHAAEKNPGLRVLILEKTSKLLTKVKVSGGGRCNVTHHCYNPFSLAHHYPRGEKMLKTVFKSYQASDVAQWFDSKGVKLKNEPDGRMFPVTDSSQTVVDCFMREAGRLKIEISTGKFVSAVEKSTHQEYSILTSQGDKYYADKILIAIGGSANKQAYKWLEDLGHKIIKPIPSLFTFNDSKNNFKDLMGISVQDAEVKIASTKFVERGPVLITHWGLSGPAIIKLSAWAADYLFETNYEFNVLLNWTGSAKEETLRNELAEQKKIKQKQKIVSNPMYSIPLRLWQRLCDLSEIEDGKIWGEVAQKSLNKLIENLIRCPFHIKGKTTFKEEFVTCGGVDLQEINIETMQSKIMPNVYFAGEVLNIDGETGGFNFQAAWSTAFVAAQSI